MQITTMIDDVEILIKESAARLNLKQVSPKDKPFKADADNQYSFTSMGLNEKIKLYLIAHKDVSVVYDFLGLSPSTIKNIEKARKFIAHIVPNDQSIPHIIHKIHISAGEGIELSIIGSGCSSFTVSFRNGMVSFHTAHISPSYSLETYNFESYDDLDALVNTAVNKVIPSFIHRMGFEGKDEKSPEVIEFIEKTAEQMFFEKGVNPLFNYMKPNELVKVVCSDLNLNLNDVMQSLNCNENDSFANLYIPSNLTTMMSTMAQRLVNIDGIKNKMDQLISLVVLYNHITSEQQKFSVSFTPIQKRNFFKESSSDITFYTFNFSKTLVIHIGHNLKRDEDGDPAYIDNNDEFKFFSFVHLKDIRNSDYKEYLSNDIDYVYNALLTDLRTIVNTALCKDDELISFKDLEVYKMVQI